MENLVQDFQVVLMGHCDGNDIVDVNDGILDPFHDHFH